MLKKFGKPGALTKNCSSPTGLVRDGGSSPASTSGRSRSADSTSPSSRCARSSTRSSTKRPHGIQRGQDGRDAVRSPPTLKPQPLLESQLGRCDRPVLRTSVVASRDRDRPPRIVHARAVLQPPRLVLGRGVLRGFGRLDALRTGRRDDPQDAEQAALGSDRSLSRRRPASPPRLSRLVRSKRCCADRRPSCP